jgi:hypothetical protein
MNVLVIPEDFRKDQHILRPMIEAMLASLGKARAKVEVCRDPLLGGIAQALNFDALSQLVSDWPMIDLFLLCVDRDGEAGRRDRLDALEGALQPLVKKDGAIFLAENAWQELEVWTLAGHELLPGWTWAAIRNERDPKEVYFVPLAEAHDCANDEDGGRKRLSISAAKRFKRVYKLCPEDIRSLHDRVRLWVEK